LAAVVPAYAMERREMCDEPKFAMDAISAGKMVNIKSSLRIHALK